MSLPNFVEQIYYTTKYDAVSNIFKGIVFVINFSDIGILVRGGDGIVRLNKNMRDIFMGLIIRIKHGTRG